MQLGVILLAAKAFGRLFRKIGQPAAVGEMAAGISLGPSVLGALSPASLDFLFPESSLQALKLFGQLGVILYMAVVGMELNGRFLRERARAAVAVSHASIAVPFLLGVALSAVIHDSYAPAGTSFRAFALFMGIAMSITAFPVLSRIIEERGLAETRLGNTALACAAVDDVTAWCLLAAVIALVNTGGAWAALPTVAAALVFIAFMLLLIRPQVGRRLGRGRETRSGGGTAGGLAFILACAWVTEVIGIHALFGAFLAGAVLSGADGYRSELRGKLGDFSSTALLPVFFAFTGLRTQINLLGGWEDWATCLVVIAVAAAGKLGGSMLAARWTGMSWSDSFSLGALMNTRGLMELVVLNVGYDLGILPARVFSMMVLMALVTTFMAGPLLTLARAGARSEHLSESKKVFGAA